MNQRIKELADRSGISRQYQEEYFGPKLLEQFAELIVRECAELCEGEAIFAGMNGRKDASASNCATIIRKHFGVEE